MLLLATNPNHSSVNNHYISSVSVAGVAGWQKAPHTASQPSFHRVYSLSLSFSLSLPLSLSLSSAEVVSVKTLPETGCQVTTYKNTGESVARNRVKVILHNRDLWAKFHKSTTEMIITKAGRSVSSNAITQTAPLLSPLTCCCRPYSIPPLPHPHSC